MWLRGGTEGEGAREVNEGEGREGGIVGGG